MFLARTTDDDHRLIVGVGLRPADLERLEQGLPLSFALSDAGYRGPEQAERVLVAYARPDQLEQFRHGYFPGITDARVVLFLDHAGIAQMRAGRPVNIQTPGAPVARFVVFAGTEHGHAERAFRAVGIAVRITTPEPRPAAERRDPGERREPAERGSSVYIPQNRAAIFATRQPLGDQSPAATV
jgi:hypothetical protein